MSLMGYTEEDVVNMANAQRIMLISPPSKKIDDVTREYLMKTFHFLEGMLVEGRI